jgi:hypothetical protein
MCAWILIAATGMLVPDLPLWVWQVQGADIVKETVEKPAGSFDNWRGPQKN